MVYTNLVCGSEDSVYYQDFNHLDAWLMHFRQLFGRYFTVFYPEAITVLDIKNLFGYTDSRDYSEREAIQSYFRETVGGVLGVAVNL
jgi:hypothetical protein